jgi:hypothetical protein
MVNITKSVFVIFRFSELVLLKFPSLGIEASVILKLF